MSKPPKSREDAQAPKNSAASGWRITEWIKNLALLVLAVTVLVQNSDALVNVMPDSVRDGLKDLAVRVGLKRGVEIRLSPELKINWREGPPGATPCLVVAPDEIISGAWPNIRDEVGYIIKPTTITPSADGRQACGAFSAQDPGGGKNSGAIVSVKGYVTRR